MRAGRGLVAHFTVRGCEERVVAVIGRTDFVKGGNGLRISTGDKIGATQMVLNSLGMVWVEAHRFLDPLNSVLGPAQPSQEFALLNDDQIVVRVE